MGDTEVQAKSKCLHADLTSQEYFSTRTRSSNEFKNHINDVNNKKDSNETPLKDETSDYGPLSLHAGIGETSSTLENQDSIASLDSSIKYFKSTVQQLFDDFYSNINNFDEFEKTVSGILTQNGEELDINELIKGVVEHKEQNPEARRTTAVSTLNVSQPCSVFGEVGTSRHECCNSDNHHSAAKNGFSANKIHDCYAFEVTPYEEKMKQLLSNIEISKNHREKISQVTSEENLKQLSNTKKKLHNYLHKRNGKDKEVSPEVKKDRKHLKLERLDEEHREQQQSEYEESSFLYKISHFLCKKFRKGSYLD